MENVQFSSNDLYKSNENLVVPLHGVGVRIYVSYIQNEICSPVNIIIHDLYAYNKY